MNKGAWYRKLSLIAVALVLPLLNLPVQAQQDTRSSLVVSKSPCPLGFSVDFQPSGKKFAQFKATIDEAHLYRKTGYIWNVLNGKIISGQGSPEIVIEETERNLFGGSLHVTVTLDGLNPSCTEIKGSFSWDAPPLPQLFDVYSTVPITEEEKILDEFALLLLQKYFSMSGGIIAHGGSLAQGERAKRYMVEKHKIDPARIIFAEGDAQARPAIELYVVPNWMEFPESVLKDRKWRLP